MSTPAGDENNISYPTNSWWPLHGLIRMQRKLDHTTWPWVLWNCGNYWLQVPKALRVELVPPGIAAPTSSCTVTITAALDPTIPLTDDHDPIFTISDKKSFMGFQTLGAQNFLCYTPCFRLEGDLNEETLKNRQQGSGPTDQFHTLFQWDTDAVQASWKMGILPHRGSWWIS